MNNPLMSALGGAMGSAMGGNNLMGMLAQFKQNPTAMLQRAGFNVPQGVGSPQQIVQHLMNSGQLSQQQYDQARQMARQFGVNV